VSYQVIQGNAEYNLAGIQDNSVDCVCCSPPYKNRDGFSMDLMQNVFANTYRVMKPGALCFINFGHLVGFKSRGFRVVILLEDIIGFQFLDTIMWEKTGHFTPLRDHLNNLTEFVFMFSKGDPNPLDRLAVGIPYKDKSNVSRYGHGKDLRCAGNIIRVGYETVSGSLKKTRHKDGYPIGVPLYCLKLAGLQPGSTVCDPFSGYGTTGEAALTLGHNYLGFEIDQEDVDVSLERLESVRNARLLSKT